MPNITSTSRAHPSRHSEHHSELGDATDDVWQEITVELPTETTADIYRLHRTAEYHHRTRHVVTWQPRDISCGEPLPAEEATFPGRTDAVEYIAEVAPMAFAPPVLTVEAWIYDPELYISEGRKRFGWEPVARFELASTKRGDVLVEISLDE